MRDTHRSLRKNSNRHCCEAPPFNCQLTCALGTAHSTSQGVMSWASCYPLDVVKNRLQAAPNRYKHARLSPHAFR